MDPIRPAKREDQRPDATAMNAKEMSPRERAEAKAAQIRAARDAQGGEAHDNFYVNPDSIADGWVAEWKRHTLIGMDMTSHQVSLARDGWEFAETKDFPELMPAGTPPSSPVLRDGLALMLRPMVLTQEQHQRNYREAISRVSAQEQQNARSPAGEQSPFDTHNKGNSLIKQSRSFSAPMAVPE